MGVDNHLKEASGLYKKALQEFQRAKSGKDGTLLRDACAKGWLSTIEAANALLIKSGIKEEELPQAERGRRCMVFKYAPKELRLLYLSLRDSLHTQGYHDGSLNFDEMEEYLDDLDSYIQRIEAWENI